MLRRGMPRRSRQEFRCAECGHATPRWEGRCVVCGAWGRYVAQPNASRGSGAMPVPIVGSRPCFLAEQPFDGGVRQLTGMQEIDRLLGGGLVPGAFLLMAGEPGVGKSTLLLQIAAHMGRTGRAVLYVSGEESGAQVRLRAERLDVADASVLFSTETRVEHLLEHLRALELDALVVDSVQTLSCEAVGSSAGSVAQVRDCAHLLLRWAKDAGVATLLAGHVTKDGVVAGPRVLEHMVDVVLYLEGEDPAGGRRVLRSTKNRFGPTQDVALLDMGSDGLRETSDPSAKLIAGRRGGVPGSAVVATLAGTRPLMAEVQALTSRSAFGQPRRATNGVDFNRLLMLSAVLARRAGVCLTDQDLMVSVVGGLRVSEPASDLAVVLAIASSQRDRSLAPEMICVGEVGLIGEVRRVSQIERRLAEAARHGFTRALVPSEDAPVSAALEVVPVGSVLEALAVAGLEGKPVGRAEVRQ